MVENIHIYQKEKVSKNVNIRQKVKPITSKVILKRSDLKTIEENSEEADVNLKKGSNPYQYNAIDDFR